jgi:hypothetical protein
MIGDLGKAIALKAAGIWEIESWTFIANYPISESVARDVVKAGAQAGIDVSWRGLAELAVALQEYAAVRQRFPALQVNEVADQLEAIHERVEGIARDLTSEPPSFSGAPKTKEQEAWLIAVQADFWEYRLFAGGLYQGREALEPKYLDHNLGIVEGSLRMDFHDAQNVLSDAVHRVATSVATIDDAFDPAAQEPAFGAPGEPGNAAAIRHLAHRVLAVYEELLDAASQFVRSRRRTSSSVCSRSPPATWMRRSPSSVDSLITSSTRWSDSPSGPPIYVSRKRSRSSSSYSSIPAFNVSWSWNTDVSVEGSVGGAGRAVTSTPERIRRRRELGTTGVSTPASRPAS